MDEKGSNDEDDVVQIGLEDFLSDDSDGFSGSIRMTEDRKRRERKRLEEESNPVAKLRRVARELDLPTEAVDLAYRLFVKARHYKVLKRTHSMAIAAVYASCRITRKPRSLTHIARTAGIPQKSIGSEFRALAAIGEERIPNYEIGDVARRVCSLVGVSSEIESKVIRLAEKTRQMELLAGRDPFGISGAALYIVSLQEGLGVTQKQVATASSVTEVTIRNRYQEILEGLKQEPANSEPAD